MTRRTYVLFGALVVVGGLFGFFIVPALTQLTFANAPTVACNSGTHYSYYSTAQLFDDAYAAVGSTTPDSNVKGITVNHHLLAATLAARVFGSIATDKPVTVLLISPNHFNHGEANVITSAQNWQTPYGLLSSDCEKVAALARDGIVHIEEGPFKEEHGISSIVPFIKHSLPNARIVPVIIKDTLPRTERERIALGLYKELGPNIIVIGSFDFSHYLPGAVAAFHDDKALAVLERFDYDGAQTLDIDSIPGVEVMLRVLEQMKAQTFTVVDHSNSSIVLRDPTLDSTTSYINGTFSVGGTRPNQTTTILAFGDMMLDRYVRTKIAEEGPEYPFLPLKRFLIGSDVVLVNSEGPFTHNASVIASRPQDLIFTFDPGLLSTIRTLGFTLLSQANNHALNFGLSGLRESQDAITGAGMETFGDPMNENPGPYYKTIRGMKVAFVGFHQFMGNDARTLAAINEAHTAGAFVIVYPHWGTEYSPAVSAYQEKEGHAFIDAGADLVLGSHPHVIEPIEIYKGRAIFYSLGNFIFDQARTGPTAEGLSVGVTITPQEVRYTLMPVSITAAQAALMSYSDRSVILNHLSTASTVPDTVRAGIAAGAFTLNR